MELKLLPVAEGSPGDFAPEPLSGRDSRTLARIHVATRHRCKEIGRPASLVQMALQLGVRQAVYKPSTNTGELAVMRKFLRAMCRARQEAEAAGWHLLPGEAMPRHSVLELYLCREDWPLIERVRQMLDRFHPSGLKEFGLAYLDTHKGKLKEGESFRDRALMLAGARRPAILSGARRPPQKRWKPITAQMFARLFEELPPSAPGSALAAAREGKSLRSVAARLFARAAWLTGMRSGEITGCRVMEPPPDSELTEAEEDEICANPLRAEAEGRLVRRAEFGGDAAETALSDPAKPPPRFLFIGTSKIACSARLIDNAVRVQNLAGMDPGDLDWLLAASMLGSLPGKGREIDNARNACSVLMRAASRKLFPDRADPITLHTLRHAFIDNARAIMSEPEMAALTGHTSPVTSGVYGGKRRRRKRRSDGRWMPRPSPAAASEIAAVWKMTNRKCAPAPVARPSPTPFDAAAPSPADACDGAMP